MQAGKVILSVSKGVATWRKGNKKSKKEEAKTSKNEVVPVVNTAADTTRELK